MKTDGGLSDIFKKALPKVHWQRIETQMTGLGVPDMNGCFNGAEFWIEMKSTGADKVKIDKEQVAWAERRIRVGGKVLLAIRKHCSAGPRRQACDELHLFGGVDTRLVFLNGLKANKNRALGIWKGGPSRWDWEIVAAFLSPL